MLVRSSLGAVVVAFGFVAGCGGSPSSSESSGLPDVSGIGPREGKDPAGTILTDEIKRELGILRETRYQHTIHVDEGAGVFDVDCSGFTDYAIARAAPAHFRELAAATRPRPLAEDYVSFFGDGAAGGSARSWQPIGRVEDLVPGDFVAWLAPADSGNTGHVVVVRDKPARRDSSSFLVPMWDATHTPHGPSDARSAGGTGIGEATIVLIVDAATGAPQQHEWYDGAKPSSERIAMGRAR